MDWSSIYVPILQALGVGLAGIITGFLVKFLKAKTGIALDEAQQAQAKQIVQGIEDKAIGLLKTGAPKVLGTVKHADAVTQLQTLNPALTQGQAVSQVDRAVGSLPNVGALTQLTCPPGV